MEKPEEIEVILWSGTAMMILLVVAVIFLALYYQNHVLKIKKNEAELLLKAAIVSEKKERQRIAADLHDGVAGDLNAIKNYLIVLKKGEQDIRRQQLFAELKNGIEVALENTRAVSYKLMPSLLEHGGFVVTMEDYFARLSRNTSRSFTVECKDNNIRIKSEIGYELLRIFQEFTTNMLKHGHITTCSVIIYRMQEKIHIEIIDDGEPYNFTNMATQSIGTGLTNINFRLKVLGAELQQRDVVVGNHFLITLDDKL